MGDLYERQDLNSSIEYADTVCLLTKTNLRRDDPRKFLIFLVRPKFDLVYSFSVLLLIQVINRSTVFSIFPLFLASNNVVGSNRSTVEGA